MTLESLTGKTVLILGVLVAAFGGRSTTAGAQTVETPVAFDSAHSMRVLTPIVVARLRLVAPAWPVSGDFVQARLFARGDGFVLVVERNDGALERHDLDGAARLRLREAVDAGAARAGGIVAEADPRELSASAGSGFVGSMTRLSAISYGPALASLMPDPTTGSVVYLASVGATYFGAAAYSASHPVTRAQAIAASSGGKLGAGVAAGLTYALNAETTGDFYAGAVVIGGLGSSLAAFNAARIWTDGEAEAAGSAAAALALTTTGLARAAGALDNESSARGTVGAITAAGIAGWFAGPRYVRRAGYGVTAGDVKMVTLGGMLGIASAATPIASSDSADERVVAGVLTAGYLTGLFVGDRVFARRYDFTRGEAGQVRLGALVGAVVGAIPPTIARTENGVFAVGSMTAGAMLGTAAAIKIAKPRAGRTPSSPDSRGAPQWEVSPGGLASLALKRPRATLVRLRF